MTRDPRYDILFEPVKIGPVTAKNRFYQVPHCNGMGFNWPQTHAKMREMKAEGGWAVICTEECMIHPSSDYSPEPQARLWDDHDVKYLSLMVEAVEVISLELGIRFLTDHLRGDTYFKLSPADPRDLNRVRGLVQLKLFEKLREKSDAARQCIERWSRG